MSMFTRTIKTLLLNCSALCALNAGTINLVDTIPSGNFFLQPPVLTAGGNFLAYGFTASTSATLDQISVVVQYLDVLTYSGRSPMLLSLFTGSGNLPGTAIESWMVPLPPTAAFNPTNGWESDTSLTLVTVNSLTHSLLLAGQQYWLAETAAASNTAIGWALASPGYPGIQLPQASKAAGSNVWGGGSPNLSTEFSVSGTTVPEPATFSMGAIVLLLILAACPKGRTA